MNRYEARLRARFLWDEYSEARAAGDALRMRAILQKADFAEMEIESILWSKGDLGGERATESRSDKIYTWLGQSLICGILLGGLAAYHWGGFTGINSSDE